ncbi:MAG: bifunctional ornithine acetyltransferase/N-acetylglutamate synthase, partial [Firmicutes bacterium]|nr:bifunctional ornithine acetyltransferase/N-acetylglutamate synthase [Bacillota bacterium]
VKAAMFGCDANWGRVLCAMGYSGAVFDQNTVDVAFKSDAGSIDVFLKGVPQAFDEDRALEILREERICIDIDMNTGSAEARSWGCDLTEEYVKINGDYRS